MQAVPLASVALGGSGLVHSALAAPATPIATPEVEPLPPEVIFERLMVTAVTTPLFPSDTGAITPTEWTDDSDSDLDGVVGGVLMQTGRDENDNPVIVGVYIVHPTNALAQSRIESQLGGSETPDTTWPPELFGYTVASQQVQVSQSAHITGTEPGFSLIAMAVGPVIVTAIGEGGDPATTDARALGNLAGMLDHLRLTLAME